MMTNLPDLFRQRVSLTPFTRYMKSLQWFHIPLSVGFAFLAFQQFRHIRKREQYKHASHAGDAAYVASNLEVSLIRSHYELRVNFPCVI